MRYLALALLGLVTLAVSTDAGTDVAVQSSTGGPQRVDISPATVRECVGQRWEAYEVEEPVTIMRRVIKYRLVDYPISIPSPGPQPPDQIISEPVVQTTSTVDCIPCQQLGTNVSVDVGTQSYAQPVEQQCPDGQCDLIQGARTKVRRGIIGRILGR
ncbi:MAG: hypothetical protein GY759_07195 [Chloroflexi bacterium]|nr:hypothetical protein [Chloroflexota bacterium]